MLIAAKRVIAGDGHSVFLDYAVQIGADGRIRTIGKKSELTAAFPSEELLDYPNGTLLPGLIDLHAHLGHFAPARREWQNDYMLAYITLHHAEKAIRNGVTTLRDVATPHMVTQTMQTAAKMGYADLPRIYPCDPGICITGGHGSAYGLGEGVEEADGPWAIRAAVRKRVKAGCKWIKAMASHHKEACEFTDEELKALVEESHRLEVKVAAHASTHQAIQKCIEAGVDTIEHGTFMTKEQALMMAERGIAWVPTILPYDELLKAAKNAPESPQQQENLRRYTEARNAYSEHFMDLAKSGVLIGAGTDLIIENGETEPAVARELKLMVDCGYNSLQAIQVGTSNGAKILGLEHVTGQIRPGLTADLLVVDGDPTLHIEDLTRVRHVLTGGKTVYLRK